MQRAGPGLVPCPIVSRRTLHAPAVLLTGNPSAGKTTLARALSTTLGQRGIASEVLDGDELRDRLPPQIGFSPAERAQQLQRAVFLAEVLASHGVVPILALVAPFARDRDAARERFAKTAWLEVFLDPPAAVCVERDSRGLYARLYEQGGRERIASEVLDIYEPPAAAALRVDTSTTSVEVAAARVAGLVDAELRPSASRRREA